MVLGISIGNTVGLSIDRVVGEGISKTADDAVVDVSFGKVVSDDVREAVGLVLTILIRHPVDLVGGEVVGAGVVDAVGAEVSRDIGNILIAIRTANATKENMMEEKMLEM